MLRQRNDAPCATGMEAKLLITYQDTATDDDDESDADNAAQMVRYDPQSARRHGGNG